VTTLSPKVDPWTRGVYLVPDAARILRLPADLLRTWVSGRKQDEKQHFPLGDIISSGTGLDRHFGFLTLVELYLVAQLRKRGVTMPTIRADRDELARRYKTPHPFALGGILTSGKGLLKELGDGVLLELGTSGQTAIQKIIHPFCTQLDFDQATLLARRFFPLGRNHPIVVDPRHAFGRPVIEGTNITTEAIMSLLRGGEPPENIAESFSIPLAAVNAARSFEQSKAA